MREGRMFEGAIVWHQGRGEGHGSLGEGLW